MKQVKNNGKGLERAVHFIQETILRQDPKLNGAKFTIERNKIFSCQGSRHEVDVYVVTNPGTDHESAILFECKDWKKPVSKNDVIILAHKVQDLGATRGFLVAREISRDAAAEIQKDKRLRFQRCSNEVVNLLQFSVTHTIRDSVKNSVRLSARNPEVVFPSPLRHPTCRLGGVPDLFLRFCHQRVDAIRRKDELANSKRLYSNKGVYWQSYVERHEFSVGELEVEGEDIAWMELSVVFLVRVGHHLPTYQFSIEGRGHVVSFEMPDPDCPEQHYSLDIALADTKAAPKSNSGVLREQCVLDLTIPIPSRTQP